jgi:hypothetical protein
MEEPKVNKGYPAGREPSQVNRPKGGPAPVPQANEPEKAQHDKPGSPTQTKY